MNEEVIFVTDNIAIVQTQENAYAPSTINSDELSEYYSTIYLPVAESKPISGNNDVSIKLLFGSWLESGTEDEQLDELYGSRLNPSTHGE